MQIKRVAKSAFFIGSPFQCLCAFEAIKRFEISNYDIYIYDSISGSDMIKRLLAEKELCYKPILRKSRLISYLLLIFKKHPRYKNLFIGNMFDNVSYSLSAIYADWHPRLYFLDDGIQALAYFGESHIPNPLKKRGTAILFDTLFKLKRLKQRYLFTIYDVTSSDIKVIHNELSIFKTEHHNICSGVFIIGTNSSVLAYKDKSYYQYLNALLDLIKNTSPGEAIYYCPHRRDSNNDHLKKFCVDHEIIYYNTRVSIEYDLIRENHSPLAIIGFASNALFVLHAIYPQTVVSTIHYELMDEDSNRIAAVLEKRLNDNGISSIHLF